MKLLTAIITVLTITITAAAEPKDVPTLLQDCSVTIRSGRAEGSGVFKVTKDGQVWVWTCGHVIADLRKVRSVISSGSEKKLIEFDDAKILQFITEDGRKVGEHSLDAEVIRYSDADNGEDLALLRIRSKRFKAPASAKFHLEKTIPPIGSDLFHCGSLLGVMGSNSLTAGIMSQHGRIYQGKIYDQTTCTSFPGCLPADMLVEMADGSVRPIVEVKEGDDVLAYDSMISMADGTWRQSIQEGQHVLSFQTMTGELLKKTGGCNMRPVTKGKVTKVIESGVKEIYEIKTGNRMLRASGNHPLVVIRSVDSIDRNRYLVATWCRTDEIVPGDVIGVIQSHVPFRKSEGLNFAKTFGQGVNKRDIMRLLGFYVGDGYSRIRAGEGGEVSLYTFNDEDSDFYSGIIERNFGYKPKRVRTNSGEYLQVTRVAFAEKIKSLRICGYATTKRIPDWVYKCPPDLQMSFLEGLVDADGHRSNKGTGSWQIELANENLIKDVWMLANHLGIRTSNISSRERIACLSGREIRSHTWSCDLYPNTSEKDAEMPGNWDLLPTGLKFERVRSVEMTGSEMTYDLTVAGYHNFFANGVLVHNSSGGVVCLKSDGSYVGMIVRGSGEGFNLMVPVRRMVDWSKRVGIEFALDDKLPVPSHEELRKQPVEDRPGLHVEQLEKMPSANKVEGEFRTLPRILEVKP